MADDAATNIVDMRHPGDEDGYKIKTYVNEVMLYDREVEKWDRQCKRILRRYKDDRGGDGEIENHERKFNALWSIVQNLKPVLYAKNPKPDIQRRFKDADPVGRISSDVLERSISYFVDTDLFSSGASQCVLDYLLVGRGTFWVRYVPHMRSADEQVTDDAVEGEETAAPEIVDYEEVLPDYVHRKDFGHNVCRTWDEVWLCWRIVYLDRTELTQRFGPKGKVIPLDYVEKTPDNRVIDDGNNKAIIYEAWDKRKKKACWFHKSMPDALDVRDDPLGLEHFFPCPKPLLTNLANDSLVPVPDYVEYQDQAMELDSLTQRISSMTRSIKSAGVYDASAQGISRLLNEGTENELIPVENFALLGEKGGLAGVINMLPIKDTAAALMSLYEARDKVKADLDEITGMSDIIRGNTDPRETAAAQNLKSGYATQRLSDRQRDVQRFIRETIRIMTDVMANHFQLETIKLISGVRLFTQAEKQAYQMAMQQPPQPSPSPGPQGGMPQGAAPPPQPPPMPAGVTPDQFQQMMADPTWEEVEGLIRNKPLRCFRIDIETDSTIKMDEETEKASRMEYVKTVGEFIAQAENAPPELAPLMGTTLLWLSRAFPVGKELEGMLTSTVQKLEKMAANPQPKPNPEMMKIQGEQQIAQAKLQQEGQLQQAQMQADQAKEQAAIQLEHVKAQTAAQTQAAQLQGDLQAGAAKLQQDKQLAEYKMQIEAQSEQHENQLEAQREAAKLDAETKLELEKARIQQETAIAVARINAKATNGVYEEAEAQTRDEVLEGRASVTTLHQKMDEIMSALGNAAQSMTQAASAIGQHGAQTAQSLNGLAAAHGASQAKLDDLHKAVTSEKELVRDPKTGKATGVRVKPSKAALSAALQ